MFSRWCTFVLSACIACASAMATAGEFGSRADAIAMVKRVQAKFQKYGAEATFAAITGSDEFRDRDLYPFVYDMAGWSVAHGANPRMVGKLWISIKDQDGNFLIQQMVAVTRGPGTGWVNYKWPNPITHKIQDKSAYIEKLGDRYFVGVGVYRY